MKTQHTAVTRARAHTPTHNAYARALPGVQPSGACGVCQITGMRSRLHMRGCECTHTPSHSYTDDISVEARVMFATKLEHVYPRVPTRLYTALLTLAQMISAEAPVMFAKACEIFVLELSMLAWNHTEENKRRTLQRHAHERIHTCARYMYCVHTHTHRHMHAHMLAWNQTVETKLRTLLRRLNTYTQRTQAYKSNLTYNAHKCTECV